MLGFVEDHKRTLAITPSEVPEQLTYSMIKLLGTVPELTFSDKHVTSFVTNEDIRLASGVEGLSSRFAFVMSIELD